MKILVTVLIGLGVAVSAAQGALLGDLAGEPVTWGDDLVDAGEIDAVEQANLLDGTTERADWGIWYGGDNHLSLTFTSVVHVTTITNTFQVGNLNHIVPIVSLYRDPDHQQLVAETGGNLNPGNGFYDTVMSGLDEYLQTLYFVFTRPSGSPSGARNTILFIELELAGTLATNATAVTSEIFTAVEISWDTLPGETYQVQWTSDAVSGTWIPLEPAVVGDGTTFSALDSTQGVTERLYRVMRFD